MNTSIDKEDISMTQQAIDHVYIMLTERGHGIGLRLGVKALGCSGYAYNIGFLDKTGINDKVFEINRDIKIAVDADSFNLAEPLSL